MLKKTIFQIGILSLLTVRLSAQTALYDTTAKPQLISRQFAFTEGASTDK
jgi:gluconolactonase